MRVFWLQWSLICLLVSGLAAQQDTVDTIRPPNTETTPDQFSSRRAPPEALYSRQTRFRIPFTAEPSGNVPTEVQLLVSGDRGANWEWYASNKLEEKNFEFRAARDGEVWFASRTVAVAERKKPVEGVVPELIVRIDTRKPLVQFDALSGAGGQVTAQWKISDEYLDVKSLRIDYQTGIGQKWIPVDLRGSAENENSREVAALRLGARSHNELVGKTAWTPDTTERFVDVRLEVRDLAGNREIVSKRVFQPRTNNHGSTSASPSSQPPQPPQPPTDPLAQRKRPSGIPWPSNNQRSDASDSNGLEGGQYGRVEGAVRPPVTQQTSADRNSDGRSLDGDNTLENHSPPTTDVGSGPPAGENPSMTNSKRFNLDYDLESVGPSGVREVELWSTRDGGANWVRWGLDVDNKSPFLVEVQEEGTYGFRMVVVGGTGLASTRPRSGDMADIWVTVDLTKPTCRITSAIYGTGQQAGQLDIRWEASDARLSERPVTLLYAAQPNGPWERIAAGLPNSGQHNWTVPGNAPQEVFLKIEVRDEAGNIGSYAVERAVSIEGLAPKGKIRGVRSTPAETTRAKSKSVAR